MNMPLVLLNRRRRGTGFNPASLFGLNEPGVWYDPSDTSTLFQDPAGTTPVTTPGQAVALMLDKSRGLTLGTELVVNGDFSDGSTGWIVSAQCSISGGAANLISTDGSYQSFAKGSFSVVAGKFYKVSVTITRWVSGTLRMQQAGGLTAVNFPTAVGTYEVIVTAAGTTSASLYFDRAGGVTDLSVDIISVRELPGAHATQATAASRPIYGVVPQGGRRNLLTFSEDFRNTATAGSTRPWIYNNGTVTANAGTAPNGEATADLLFPASTGTFRSVYQNTAAAQTISVYAKAAGKSFIWFINTGGGAAAAWFNITTGAVGTVLSGYSASIQSVGSGWYRCSLTSTTSGNFTIHQFGASDADNSATATVNGTDGVLVWGAQLETGSTATPYQRVTTQYEVTEAGVPSCSYLFFDGGSDSMATGSIDFTATDKMTVWAGVRKNSDAAFGMIAELSPFIVTNNGSFSIGNGTAIGGGASYNFASKGSLIAGETSPLSFASPITNVLTGLGDISGDRATLRIDGTQAAQSTTDQGTGNYGNYPLYIGARAGTSLFFNGNLFGLVVRGAASTTAQITATEAWLAPKTGVVLP